MQSPQPLLQNRLEIHDRKQFEIKLYSGNSPEILLDRAGVITLGCNIHDWMIAYVVVVPTPYFARTDESGSVHLRDLPAGTFEVRAFHPNQRAGASPQAIALEGSAASAASFVVEVTPRKVRFKPPLDRARY